MKNRLLLTAAFLVAAVAQGLACTNFIVGKGASKEDQRIPRYTSKSKMQVMSRMPANM